MTLLQLQVVFLPSLLSVEGASGEIVKTTTHTPKSKFRGVV